MDDTVVDLYSGLQRLWPDQPFNGNHWSICEMLQITNEEFWAKINAVPTFWEDLDFTPWGRELVSYVQFKNEGVVKFVSCPTRQPDACSGKQKWIWKHFGKDFDGLTLTEDKTICAKPNHILIDDREHHLAAFQKAGGISLTCPRQWNDRRAFADDPLGYIQRHIEEWEKQSWYVSR